MRIIILTVTLISALWLYSCVSGEIADSKDVAQSQIYTKYYISMEEGQKNALVEVVFRFGGSKGTSLILTEPSKVSVNGKKLNGTERFLTGYYYSELLRQPDDYQYVFDFQDYEGKTYTNHFKLYPVSFKKIPEFNKNMSTLIELNGPPLVKNEKLELVITDTSGKECKITNSVEGSLSIMVKPEDIKEFNDGDCKVYIIREISAKPENCPEIGGIYSGTFKSKIRNSKIKSK